MKAEIGNDVLEMLKYDDNLKGICNEGKLYFRK